MTRSKSYIVDLLLISIVVIWGFNFAVMKLMYRYFHPIAFNAIRFAISSVTMFGILRLRREDAQIDRKDLRGILWLGFLGNTLYPFIFVLARKLDTNPACAQALSPRSSGRFGGSTTVRLAANTDGVVQGAWIHDSAVTVPVNSAGAS